MSLLLGIDVGTSRVKALLYDTGDGGVLATKERTTPVEHPRPGWSDFPPEGCGRQWLEPFEIWLQPDQRLTAYKPSR